MAAVSIVPRGDSAETGLPSDSWWSQYANELRLAGRLSSRAIEEIDRVAKKTVSFFPIPGEGSHRRTVGAVVGSVQSGKTGAIGGIAARALDIGYRIVVVLSGLKDDLRTQTARRLYRDLLCRGDLIYRWNDGGWGKALPVSYTHPAGKGYHGPKRDCWSPSYRNDANQDDSFALTFARRLGAGDAVLAVVKKNTSSLEAVHAALLLARLHRGPGQLPMLVLDDECDEATVDAGDDRPTSESIRRLLLDWEDQHVAYVGVTATPAANLLQQTHDPLFPSDFLEVLRHPAHQETLLGYYEPSPEKRYSGGFQFYRMLEEREDLDNFLLQAVIGDQEQAGLDADRPALLDALVAYFVSGAMRLCMQPGASPTSTGQLSQPHCLILHADGQVEDHRRLAQHLLSTIAACAGRDAVGVADTLRRPPERRLDPDDLASWLSREPERWEAWHQSFLQSQATLKAALPAREDSPLPTWEAVQAMLPEVFAATKLRIINSESERDPPLDFSPAGAVTTLPYDVYSIVVGGNRLSRGLTIEGLCISYYTRSSARWAEDTTVQRERWFGYRGAHLEFCRVFVHSDTAIRLRRFHEHEEDLRGQLAWMVRDGRSPLDTALRLMCLPDSVPTHRAQRGVRRELSLSGSRVFLDRVEMGSEVIDKTVANENEALAGGWWERIRSEGQEVSRSGRANLGWLLEDVALDEVLGLLDGLTLTVHNPGPNQGAVPMLGQYFREPDPRVATRSSLSTRHCPYMTAAYLRYWAHAYGEWERGRAGRYRGMDGLHPWEGTPPPSLNVGFRFGSEARENEGRFAGARLMNRAIRKDGLIPSLWGGHGEGEHIYGDEWFDVAPPNGDRTQPRPMGLPGLVLIHVVHKDATGRDGSGTPYHLHRPFLGISLPAGGPSFVCVVAESGQ